MCIPHVHFTPTLFPVIIVPRIIFFSTCTERNIFFFSVFLLPVLDLRIHDHIINGPTCLVFFNNEAGERHQPPVTLQPRTIRSESSRPTSGACSRRPFRTTGAAAAAAVLMCPQVFRMVQQVSVMKTRRRKRYFVIPLFLFMVHIQRRTKVRCCCYRCHVPFRFFVDCCTATAVVPFRVPPRYIHPPCALAPGYTWVIAAGAGAGAGVSVASEKQTQQARARAIPAVADAAEELSREAEDLFKSVFVARRIVRSCSLFCVCSCVCADVYIQTTGL